MKRKITALIIFLLFFAYACEKKWEEHYNKIPETIDKNVWDALKENSELSDFVKILTDWQYDTLFNSDISYTVFAPTNAALNAYENEKAINRILIDYSLTPHFFQSGDVKDQRYIQTLSEKFALFEKNGSTLTMDGVLLKEESPLFKNGKYFVMDGVVEPKPNLFEFFSEQNTVLKEYIESQDSVYLDLENSRPIGYDEIGRTVYDSVILIYNEFEELYFPVREEFRNRRATFIYPRKDEYEDALTFMAQEMNVPEITDYEDIPLDWQNTVLVPFLLKQGVFENLLEPEDFIWESVDDTLQLKNILGDSINIFYQPVDKVICSNGYSYTYNNFQIPDSLYSGATKFEMEWLLEDIGIKRYAWKENVISESDKYFIPLKEFSNKASNDTILNVLFDRGYTGKYSLEFNIEQVFPRKYLMVVRTNMNVGGIFDIYVNDEFVKTFDYYDFLKYNQVLPSVIPGKRYFPEGVFNKFDMWLDNLNDYGSIRIRFEYKGPSFVLNNGIVIDYIELIPDGNF